MSDVNRSDIRAALVSVLVDVTGEFDKLDLSFAMTADQLLPLVVVDGDDGCIIWREGTNLPDYDHGAWAWSFWAAVDQLMLEQGFGGYTESVNAAKYTWRLDA